MQIEAIFLEFSLTYDDGAPLKLGPGAKCPPCPPLLAPLISIVFSCTSLTHDHEHNDNNNILYRLCMAVPIKYRKMNTFYKVYNINNVTV